MSYLPIDCLNEIFEYLEDYRLTLYSCILVNRLWCGASVSIFWRNISYYSRSNFRTLIACLPNESKEILYENGIIIPPPISKFPTFNYAAFCQVLSINQVYDRISELLKYQQVIYEQTISSQNLDNNTHIVVHEIFKMLMNQVTSLKSLVFSQSSNETFYLYPGAKDCLKNLTELRCCSDIPTELFYQLSQICYNIQSLTIQFNKNISNSGIADLISVQRNLKCFYLSLCHDDSLTNIIFPLMTKLPNTLIKLGVYGGIHYIPLSFIVNFSNLQELMLYFEFGKCFVDFEKLQYGIFSQLQVLDIGDALPIDGSLEKFLEYNGKNLKEIYVGEAGSYSDNSLNLVISKFCPMLRKLSTGIKDNELETLKIIFNSCKYLESIRIWCGGEFLSEKQALETFVKNSLNIYELILFHRDEERFKLLPEELESFVIEWTDCKPQKLLSLVVVADYIANSLNRNVENIEIINKYIKLGIIGKFKATDYGDVEYAFDNRFIYYEGVIQKGVESIVDDE